MRPPGLEPRTISLKGCCSTIELWAHMMISIQKESNDCNYAGQHGNPQYVHLPQMQSIITMLWLGIEDLNRCVLRGSKRPCVSLKLHLKLYEYTSMDQWKWNDAVLSLPSGESIFMPSSCVLVANDCIGIVSLRAYMNMAWKWLAQSIPV